MTIKTNTARLPVPPPKAPEESAAEKPFATPADAEDIPAFLKLTKEQRAAARAKTPTASAKPDDGKPDDPTTAKVRAEVAAAKKAKTNVRIAKLKGATAAMPLAVKSALAKIESVDINDPKLAEHPVAKANAASWPTGEKIKSTKPKESSVKTSTKTKTAKAPKSKATTSRAKPTQKPAGRSSARSGGVRPGSKLELILGLLCRKSGCTSAEVLNATGWPSVSMPQTAKALGVKLVKEKEKGKPSVYRAA